MARRDLLSHSVWLRSFDGEEADGRVAGAATMLHDGIGDLLPRLNRMGYLVESWREVDVFRVRLYPIREQLPLGQPPLSLSYQGANLLEVLRAALADASCLARGERRYHQATREHVRWVA